MIYCQLFFLLITSYITTAQISSYSLDNDPVFTAVLNRRLTYPREAERSSIYARVYTRFRIDENGRIQDIAILNSISRGTRFGFEPTVVAALKKLPPLNLRYTGNYILPVAFVFVDYRHKDKPFIPRDTLYNTSLTNCIFLNEVKVFGNSVNSRERIKAAARNEGY